MFKLVLLLTILFVVFFYVFDITTKYLQDKPKTHKFRQWWSNNMVDLDDNFSE